MSLKIAAYMKHLAGDAEARAEFERDPTAAMTGFGLNAHDQSIVASRDTKKIQAEIAKSDPALSRSVPITF